MKHARILLTIGLWMAFIPFTGIPFRWHQILFLIAGILVVIWSFRIYITLKKTESPSKKEPFKIKKASKEEDFEDDPAIPESLQPKLELVAKPEPVEKEAPEEKKETAPSAAYIAPKNQIKKEAASRSVEEPK